MDTSDLKKAVEVFMAAQAWPSMGVLVRRFFK